MEFSFDTAQNNRSSLRSKLQASSTDSPGLSSDRLQRAIERNRAKQARRASTSSRKSATSSTAQQDMTDALKQRLLKKREGMGRTRTSSNLPSSAPSSLRQSSTFEDSGEIVVVPKSRPSRNNVAVAGRATFTGTKKKTDKLPAPIRYLGLGKATSKSKRKNKKFFDHLVVFGWICMALLGVRLLLSDRGIIDFYKHKAVLESIHHDIEQLKVDNGELMAEIEKIRSSSRYQKKIVRDYLGFIAKNEYLILFAKGRSPANSTN